MWRLKTKVADTPNSCENKASKKKTNVIVSGDSYEVEDDGEITPIRRYGRNNGGPEMGISKAIFVRIHSTKPKREHAMYYNKR